MIKDINSAFKKFGGSKIASVIDYIKDKLDHDPNLTISIGCDSKHNRSRTLYAITITLYNNQIKNGAHVIFNRHHVDRVPDTFTRLYKEAEYMNQLANFLQENLKDYKRNDLTEIERKKYKYHTLQQAGKYQALESIDEYNVINNIFLSDVEKTMEYGIADIHLDYNVFDDPMGKNRSHVLTKSTVPWLKGQGFRVFCKPMSYGASTAADLLLKG